MGIDHIDSGAQMTVISSKSKTSLGIVNCPMLVLDEPSALEQVNGDDLWTSITGAQGKPGSRLKIIITGTIAPGVPGYWWEKLVERGTAGSTYIQALQGDRAKWNQ